MNNLILFDESLEIQGFINVCDYEKKDNIYNNSLNFVMVESEVFFSLVNLANTNKLIFKSNPILMEAITVESVTTTPLPPVIIPPTKEQVLATALMENELQSAKLAKETQLLATSSMQGELNNVKLNNQVTALSKAILELTLNK